MQRFNHLIAIFTFLLLFSSDSTVSARRHRRQALCSPSISPSPTMSPPSPPTTTPLPTSTPPSPGPPNPPICNVQPAGICQLATKCQPANNPAFQDVWVFNAQCNVIGGTTGLTLGKTWDLASQLPYVIIMTGNSPTASPSFLYAGGMFGVGGSGNPGWWCAIESDGTYDCFATFNC